MNTLNPPIGTFIPGKYKTRDGSVATVVDVWCNGYYLRGFVQMKHVQKTTKWASNTGWKICYHHPNRHDLIERIPENDSLRN